MISLQLPDKKQNKTKKLRDKNWYKWISISKLENDMEEKKT